MSRGTCRAISFVLALGLLVSCGNDTVAGKTTTTSNGGGVVALGIDGRPLGGCTALAARSWDPLRAVPGIVDTLHGDSAGFIQLSQDAYAFIEIVDGSRLLGARIKRFQSLGGTRSSIALDTLRPIHGVWADRRSVGQGRLLLDSSFATFVLRDTSGAFDFEKVPPGDYTMTLDAQAQPLRPMGAIRLSSRDILYRGSGNVVMAGDTTGSPLWIDDFESGTNLPMLRQSYPATSPWYLWWVMMDMSLPVSSASDSFLRAVGPDSTRPGRSYHSRFKSLDPHAWVALGIAGMEIDLSARTQICFSYRTDSLVNLQFQRDSVAGGRPSLSTTVPSSLQWRDVCVPTSALVPNTETPDSLKAWNEFARRVLVIEFQSPGGATFLDLDDIRIR